MAEPPAAGDLAPDFRLPSTHGDVSLSEMLARGSRLLLAFYFEDATPACEMQIAMLRDAYDTITAAGAVVVAVSSDSIESHRAFARHLGDVPFPLASDATLDAARAYSVVADDDRKRSRRAAFVIGPDGTVILSIPHLQPTNISQAEAIFRALGIDT